MNICMYMHVFWAAGLTQTDKRAAMGVQEMRSEVFAHAYGHAYGRAHESDRRAGRFVESRRGTPNLPTRLIIPTKIR